jgi:hypothetical protein
MLQITQAILGRPTWPNSTRMLISQHSQLQILPLGMPLIRPDSAISVLS